MGNNSTNTNKTNNHHLSPQIIEHKKNTTCDVGNPVSLKWDKHRNMAG